MGLLDNFNKSTSTGNHMSPFGEAGLLGDPLYWLTGGDKGKYAEFMRKTWEKPNEWASPYMKKFHELERKNPWVNPLQAEIDKTEAGSKVKGFSENKPGDAALAILGSIFAGPAIMGGIGGGGAGGATSGASGSGVGTLAGSGAPATTGGMVNSSGLGIFANGGAGGMSTVGGGNAGLLASSGGIGGGAGMGAAGTGAGPGQLSFGGDMQQYMQMAQQMGGQQQQPQSQVQAPPVADNRQQIGQMIRARVQELRSKVFRSPDENAELRQLTTGLLRNA